MRRMWTLGLALIATLGLAALGSSPAMASETCSHPTKEKFYPSIGRCITEAEYNTFEAWRNCPLNTGQNACVWAQSSLKEKWKNTEQREKWEAENGRPAPNELSRFTAGPVTVNLKNPITLQGALKEVQRGEETGLEWVAPENGAPTIVPVQQPGPPITKYVDTSKLSTNELSRYNYYTKIARNKSTTATIELAGPASVIQVNLGNLLTGSGVAFVFPVKVKVGNPFFGENCYVGSNEHPILTEFSSGASGSLTGKLGFLEFFANGTLEITNNTIVSNTFAVPGAEGCGIGGGADEALDSALGLPAAPGVNASVLNGTLRQAALEEVKAVFEEQGTA